jgi:hypothetical protein
MANRLRTLSRSTIDMDILMIRRRNLYGIFLRMIQHLLWISRHQKGGDLRADLQRAVGGKGPNERKSFPRSDPQNEQYYPMELSITFLVQAFLPVAYCLQETHLKKSDTINLKNYSVYSTYVDEDERAAGGSIMFEITFYIVMLISTQICRLLLYASL